MRTFLTWSGGLCAGILVVLIIGCLYVSDGGAKLDDQAKDFADTTIMDVVPHWDAAALKTRAIAAFSVPEAAAQLDQSFKWFGELGPFVRHEGCVGSAFAVSTITGHYVCKEHFAAGDATIFMLLVKNDGHWQVSGFHMQSPQLIPHA